MSIMKSLCVHMCVRAFVCVCEACLFLKYAVESTQSASLTSLHQSEALNVRGNTILPPGPAVLGLLLLLAPGLFCHIIPLRVPEIQKDQRLLEQLRV